MAVLSLVELLKTTTDPVEQQVALDIITADQLAGFLPMRSLGVNNALTYNREKALPTVSNPSSGASITADSALEYTKVTSYARRYLVDQDIDVLDSGSAGGMRAARGLAIQAAFKALGRSFGSDIINGSANWTVTVNSFGGTGYSAATIVVGPGHDVRNPVGIIRYTHSGTTVKYKAPGDAEFGDAVAVSAGVKIYSDNKDKWVTVNFTAGSASANGDVVFTISVTSSTVAVDGMLRLVAAGQTISSSTNGDAITLPTLDQLADTVTDTSGPKAFIMHRRTRRAVMALLRAMGGVTWMDVASAQFGNALGQSSRVPEYNGIPILCSDWIPTTRTTGSTSGSTTVVFCATLGEMGGLCGMFSQASQDEEDRGEVILQGPMGLVAERVGIVQAVDARRYRAKGYLGLQNPSEKGLAMADGITN